MRRRRLQAPARTKVRRVAAVEGVLVDELEIARHVDGREVLVRIKRTIADGGDTVVEEHARQVLAVLEGAVADVRDAGVGLAVLGGGAGDVGQSQILLAEVFHDGRAELLPLVVILRDRHVAHPRGFLTLDRVVRHRAAAVDVHAVILRVLAVVVLLPDLLQGGVVLHDGGVRDFVDFIMYTALVPGRAAVAMRDLVAEELFDLIRLLEKLVDHVRDRARLRRRGAHAQQSGREHKAQQQRQHSFFHMVPPSWNRRTGNRVYTISIQDAPRFCNGSCAHGREKMHILFTQMKQNVTLKMFFRRSPLHTFPVIWYIFDRQVLRLYTRITTKEEETMKKRVLSLALCLVLVVGLFSGLTVNASASRLDDLKKEIAEKLIKEKIEQLKRSLRSRISTRMPSSAVLRPRPPRATSVRTTACTGRSPPVFSAARR